MPEPKKTSQRRNWWLPVFLVVALMCASSTAAHFLLNLNVRIMHVEHVDEGLRLYLRTPMPYLVADKLGNVGTDDLPEAAPFTSNARLDGRIVHYVDFESISRDFLGLGVIAETGLNVVFSGQRLAGEVQAARVHRVGEEPGFATLSEAKSAISAPDLAKPPLFVGDALVDVVITYATENSIGAYGISSTLDPGLPDQEMTANLIIDYGAKYPQVFRARGLLADPVEIGQNVTAAFASFVFEGIRHILEGIDHVLFVICLVIGARSLGDLMWRITGFTLGHSVTLAMGFFGFVPSGAWFVPTIETGVALSIVYAAWSASFGYSSEKRTQTSIVAMTVLIGLFHGLGFSFVLQEILQVTSPNIWSSLLAFNVGVEIGQLIIVFAVWPFLYLLGRFNPRSATYTRWGIAASCGVFACIWAIERAGQAFATLA